MTLKQSQSPLLLPVSPLFFTFHMRCISVVRSFYFRIFSASFLITFLSPEIATSINIHVPFSLSRIIIIIIISSSSSNSSSSSSSTISGSPCFTPYCVLRLQRLLTYMFPFHYHGLLLLLLLLLLVVVVVVVVIVAVAAVSP